MVLAVESDGFVYSGYIGGAWREIGNQIAVDRDGNAYIAGVTRSPETNFPVVVGPMLTFQGGHSDAFITKVKQDGTGLEYCGYIGGDSSDAGYGIDVDGNGHAYICGNTDSTEETFPVSIGPDLTHNESKDGFIAKVSVDGSSLDYCGYIGGSGSDGCSCLALDHDLNVFVTGSTLSTEADFPIKLGPGLTHYGVGSDAFIAKVKANGEELLFCGYVGGEKGEYIESIAIDSLGNAYAAGSTSSDEGSFPVTVGPDLTHNGISSSDHDGFIFKLSMALVADADTLSVEGGEVNLYLAASADQKFRNYYILGGVTGTEPGHSLPGNLVTLPVNLDDFTYNVLLPFMNTALFSNFIGRLDGYGLGMAQIYWPGWPLPPSAIGLNMNFAFCLNSPFDFASNPVEIELTP